ncbi:hypothetical protein LguiB_014499 [Lonicera macranthoides]
MEVEVEVKVEKKNAGKVIDEKMLKKRAENNVDEKKEDDFPTFDLNIDLSRDSTKSMFRRKTEEAKTSLIEEEVDEFPTPDDEVVGKFLPLSKMKDIMAFLDPNEMKVVESTMAWRSYNMSIFISDYLLQDLMCNNFVDGQQGVRDGIEMFTKDLLDGVIMDMPLETKYLMFPMNHGRSLSDSGGCHWIFLVLNLPSLRWTHYNTMLPRRRTKQSKKSEDHYYEEVLQMLKDNKVIRAECVQQREEYNKLHKSICRGICRCTKTALCGSW